jgi:hypothetical protein
MSASREPGTAASFSRTTLDIVEDMRKSAGVGLRNGNGNRQIVA